MVLLPLLLPLLLLLLVRVLVLVLLMLGRMQAAGTSAGVRTPGPCVVAGLRRLHSEPAVHLLQRAPCGGQREPGCWGDDPRWH